MNGAMQSLLAKHTGAMAGYAKGNKKRSSAVTDRAFQLTKHKEIIR